MKKLTFEEIKDLQLEILDDLHDFCVKNNIRYSLGGGTLLGAVRHKGYIPWDDDIDLVMPRPDYERFLKEYKPKSEFYQLSHHKNNPHFVSAFAKIYDTRTLIIGPNLIDDQMVFIDIFPLDGMPDENGIDDYLEEVAQYIHKIRKVGKYHLFAKSRKDKIAFFIKYIIKRISLPGRDKLFCNLETVLKNYSFENSDFAGLTGGSYGKKEWMPKNIFEHYQLAEFEGKKYCVITQSIKYLETVYGDWQKLPPPEKRIPLHTFEAFMK